MLHHELVRHLGPRLLPKDLLPGICLKYLQNIYFPRPGNPALGVHQVHPVGQDVRRDLTVPPGQVSGARWWEDQVIR